MRKMQLAVVLFGISTIVHAQANSPKPAYDFSLPREERIQLAESAAPPEISSKATSNQATSEHVRRARRRNRAEGGITTDRNAGAGLQRRDGRPKLVLPGRRLCGG